MELTIDDRTIEANRGESVLQAALRHGIEIPHFCYHPLPVDRRQLPHLSRQGRRRPQADARVQPVGRPEHEGVDGRARGRAAHGSR